MFLDVCWAKLIRSSRDFSDNAVSVYKDSETTCTSRVDNVMRIIIVSFFFLAAREIIYAAGVVVRKIIRDTKTVRIIPVKSLRQLHIVGSDIWSLNTWNWEEAFLELE